MANSGEEEAESLEADRVAMSIRLSLLVSAIFVVLLFIPMTAKGWIAAFGASMVFGSSSLPAKHPSCKVVGPFGFQMWVTAGNATTTLLLVLLKGSSIRWSSWGAAGALILTATQCCAWPAVGALGAAAGPGIWCGVGMSVAFMWGTMVFQEAVRSLAQCLAALLLLLLGVMGISLCQSSVLQRLASSREAGDLMSFKELEGEGGDHEERGGRAETRGAKLAMGVMLALMTGVFDGSLMAPFKAFLSSSPPSSSSSQSDLVFEYLSSFALALPVVAGGTLLSIIIYNHHVLDASFDRASLKEAAYPGFCAGVLWAIGNVLSVHATLELGQSVGFPMTQSCVVISALWGIVWFKEMTNRLSLLLFLLSSVLVAAGASLLGSNSEG
eukprot:767333-Hanusia_phi.AAC.2